ncbi:hypothetical protein SLA2020_046670 [Shorea laevis]
MSRRKKGQSAFTLRQDELVNDLKGLNLPITSLVALKIAKSSNEKPKKLRQCSSTKQIHLPIKRINGFDPNAYNLLAKLGNEQDDVIELTQEFDEDPKKDAKGSIKVHKVWRKKKASPQGSQVELGYDFVPH